MRIIIAGAGIIGLTTAYVLGKRGHEVTVIDREEGVAQGASRANGGQLSYSYVDPFAGPNMRRQLGSILTGRDPGISAGDYWKPGWLAWMLAALGKTGSKPYFKSMDALLNLAGLSAPETENLLREIPITIPINRQGKLVVFKNKEAIKAYEPVLQHKREAGHKVELLTPEECSQLEPGISHWQNHIGGGMYCADELTADSYGAAQEIAGYCSKHLSVNWCLGEDIREFQMEKSKISGVITDKGEYPADVLVLAAGTGSQYLAQKLGLELRIKPVYGFSITAPAGESRLKLSVTSINDRLVFAPMGDSLRVAGYAHIGDTTPSLVKRRIQRLKRRAGELLPQAADFPKANGDWLGARPTRPDSLPLISGTPIKNVYLNTGHGSLGWTLACGSATLIGDIIERRKPVIAPEAFQYR